MKLFVAFAAGSLTFWSPMILFRVLLGIDWQIAMIPYTFIAPITFWFVLKFLSRELRLGAGVAATAALFGMWISGPFWTDVVNTFTPGEGFHQPGALASLGWMTLVFPATTFMISAYEGTMLALLAASVAGMVFIFTRTDFSSYRMRS